MDLSEALMSLYPENNWELHGENYEGLKWLDENVPKPSEDELTVERERINNERPLKVLRKERDSILSKTDKYTIPDWPHPTSVVKQAWLDYRQALRDLPANTTDPENPVWPTPPE